MCRGARAACRLALPATVLLPAALANAGHGPCYRAPPPSFRPTGNNLEAGLGSLITKRLVDKQLMAKAREAERITRELEVRHRASC